MKMKKIFLILWVSVLAITSSGCSIFAATVAPDAIKYNEKSQIAKDINSLDAVYISIKAEIMDEQLSKLSTDNPETNDVMEGMLLSDIKDSNDDSWKELSSRLFGEEAALTNNYATNKIFESKVAEGAVIKVYLNGECAVAAVAVDAVTEEAIFHEDDVIMVSSQFSDDDIDSFDCFH